MTHGTARERILTLKLEPLSVEEDARLKQHLADCDACRTYAGQIERGLAVFRSHGVRADVELIRRTRARLRSYAPMRDELLAWVPAAAALVACATLLGWGLLARRLAVWCQGWLGMTASTAIAWVGFVWLLASALGAVAAVLARGQGALSGLEWSRHGPNEIREVPDENA